MLPISEAARLFGLSRSTLLHYDRIGLLSPSYRTSAGYRLYQKDDLDKLEQIRTLRRSGLCLEAISDLLSQSNQAANSSDYKEVLRNRVHQLNYQIAKLHAQRHATLRLLHLSGSHTGSPPINRQQWIEFMLAANMSEQDMDHWHSLFEQESPDSHQDFLESIGISEKEIRELRNYYRNQNSTRATARPGPDCSTASRQHHPCRFKH